MGLGFRRSNMIFDAWVALLSLNIVSPVPPQHNRLPSLPFLGPRLLKATQAFKDHRVRAATFCYTLGLKSKNIAIL